MKITIKVIKMLMFILILLGLVSCGQIVQEESEAVNAVPIPTTTQPSISISESSIIQIPTPTTTVTSTPTPCEVKLVAVGDNLIHKKVIDSGLKKNGTYNYDHLFDHLREDFEQADIAVINQETIFGTKKMGYSGYPRFNSPTEIGDAVRKAGFDVVLHATNHVMDMGMEGLENTLSYWDDYPEIEVVGIHDSLESNQSISIVEKNGIRIALLNCTYGTNGIPVPKNKLFMVDGFDEKTLKRDIKKAKEQADFVIVFPHWGTEYVYKQNKFQDQWTSFFAEQGVDMVIGTHPHVLQPVEWVISSTGHKMLVYYSLGNYVSTMDYTDRMLGGMAEVCIKKDITGTYIKMASLTPIVTHYERGKNINIGVYKLSDYSEEMAKKHYILKDYRGKDFSYAKLNKLANDIVGDFLTKN